MEVERVRVLLSCLAVVTAGCGDDGGNPSGRYIRGSVAQNAASSSAVSNFGETHLADAIWVLPVQEGLIDDSSFRDRVELSFADDGSFVYSEDMGGFGGDAVLALVNTSACSTPAARASWVESDLDARLGCIQGFVSITDAEGGGAMTVIPLADQQDGVDLRRVTGDTTGEARSETTLAQAASSFSLDLDVLRAIAQTDDRVVAFAYIYANHSDTLADFYNMNLLYNWNAPLSSANNAPTDPGALATPGYEFKFDTNVDASGAPLNQAGYFQLYPPGPVTVQGRTTTFGPTTPLLSITGPFSYAVDMSGRLAGAAGLFLGTSPRGEWKLRRGGDAGPIVAKYDLALASPFALVNGVPDPSHPTVFLPTIRIDNTAGAVTGITWSFDVFDGSGFVAVPADLAVRMVGSPSISIAGDGSAGCPSEESARLDLEATTTWTPQATYVLGAGSATTCGITGVYIGYFTMGTLYQFGWT